MLVPSEIICFASWMFDFLALLGPQKSSNDKANFYRIFDITAQHESSNIVPFRSGDRLWVRSKVRFSFSLNDLVLPVRKGPKGLPYEMVQCLQVKSLSAQTLRLKRGESSS